MGAAKVAEGSETDDMLVNAINGGEADCVISVLSPPLQEEFIARNRSLMNTRMWLGAGKLMDSLYRGRSGGGRLLSFVVRLFFKRETRKSRREMSVQGEL